MSLESFPDSTAYRQAADRLRSAADAYYNSDRLLMGDDEYDELARRVELTEAEHPDWVAGEKLADQVAGGVGKRGDIAHSEPMLSLDNVFDETELRGWYTGLESQLGYQPDVVVEPKLDGLAVAARYEQGKLRSVITRGDGRVGEDVSANATNIAGLPARLPRDVTMEVRGEVYMTDEDFARANDGRTAAGKPPFANPRNAAAGTLRVQRERGYEAPLSFAAYQVLGEWASHSSAMAAVIELGIQAASALHVEKSAPAGIDAAIVEVEQYRQQRGELGFGIDGAVIKVDLTEDRDRLGATSRAPRFAIAYKYPAELALTRLLDIEMLVGRTGLNTPRAVLEPVSVGGATIEYATLSNPAQVAAKDLRIGDMVWVRRAGDVIPEITGPALEHRTEELTPWEPPTGCARCGEELDRSEARWRCPNRLCGLPEQLAYWCSRDCMDIEGVGPALIEALIAAGRLQTVADLYRLEAADIEDLEGWGPNSAVSAIASIEASRSQPLHRVFCALGVRMTGRSMSRRIAGHFGSMEAIRSAGTAQFCEIEGVGLGRAESIVTELGQLASLLDELAGLGIGVEKQQRNDEGPLAGKTVCISGSVPGMSRTEAQEAIERLGGKAVGSVSAKTQILVAEADGGSSKIVKARQLGLHIMDPREFSKLASRPLWD